MALVGPGAAIARGDDPKPADSQCSQLPSSQDSALLPGVSKYPSSLASTPLMIPAPSLASSRYNRQLLLPQLRLRGQELLRSSKVLIIGLGGLGSPAALYLAGAGVGTLGLMDGDNVEVSNLHRQIVHTEAAARSGISKVRSAATSCGELNSEIEYVYHEEQARADNILDIVAQYDLVLDCTDNPATRYLISDACVVLRKVLISGAAQRGEGMLLVLNSHPLSSGGEEKGPCYRCVFPRPPAPETVRGCSEIGILGPVVGMIGTMMAGEALKIISSGRHLSLPEQGDISQATVVETEKARHSMLLYHIYASDPRSVFRTITLRGRRTDCLACGDDDSLAKKGLKKITSEFISQGRLDYQAFCGIFEDVKLLAEDHRIDAAEFLQKHAQQARHQGGKRKRTSIVVDVREEHEVELGPKVSGSVNIPLSKILRHGVDAFNELRAMSTIQSSAEREVADPEEHMSRQSAAVGSDGSMINQESHIPIAKSWNSVAAVSPDGGVLNQEPHISLSTKEAQAPTVSSPDGGMIDPEMHVPVTRQTTFSSTDFPSRPEIHEQKRLAANDERLESQGPAVYFVCQRGNDSQIAAQKLMDSDETEEAAATAATPKAPKRSGRKWGWIGDVKGGFIAMERYASI